MNGKNLKIAPAPEEKANKKSGPKTTKAMEQKLMLNGPLRGSIFNGNPAFGLMPFVNHDASGINKPRQLPGADHVNMLEESVSRLVNSANCGAIAPGLSSLNLLANTATESDRLSISPVDDDHLSVSRNSSPPTLTSPNFTPVSVSPQFNPVTLLAAKYLNQHRSVSDILATTANSTNPNLFSFSSTISPASSFNTVYTTNLPNTTFSTSPIAFPNIDDGTIIKELETNSTASARGRGRGRGGGARRGNKTRVSQAANKTSPTSPTSSSSSTDSHLVVASPVSSLLSPPSALSASNSPASTSQDADPTTSADQKSPSVKAVYSPVTRRNASPDKHSKKVVLNYH